MSLIDEISHFIVEKIMEDKNPNRYEVSIERHRPFSSQYDKHGTLKGFTKTGPTVLKIEIRDCEVTGEKI